MEDALPLFGIAAVLWGAAFVIHALGYWWFRVKQLERANQPQISPASATAVVDSRLARIEAAVDAVAIEVERLGEAHRFASRLQGDAPEAQGPLPPMQKGRGHDRA